MTISHDQSVTGVGCNAACVGVRGGSWVQDADITITVQTCGIVITEAVTSWIQKGAVSISFPATADATGYGLPQTPL